MLEQAIAAALRHHFDEVRIIRGTVRSVGPSGVHVVCPAPYGEIVCPIVGPAPEWVCVPATGAGALVALSYAGSSGKPPQVIGFYAGALQSLDIGAGGSPAARVGDAVTVTLDSTAIGLLAIALLSTGMFTPSGSPVPAPAPPVTVSGAIAGGSSKVRIG